MTITREHKVAAMTLVEVLVTLALIALVSIPLFQILTTSKKMGVSAAKRTLAMNFASSWISSAADAPVEAFSTVPQMKDCNIEGLLSVSALGLTPVSDEFSRLITIEELPSPDTGSLIFYVQVSIEWENKKSGKILSYKLNRLLTF